MSNFLLEGPGGVPQVKLGGGLKTNLPATFGGGIKVTGGKYTPTLTPTSVAAATSAEQTFTVTGLTVGSVVVVNGPTPTAGTGIVNARVSAANTLALTFINSTAAAVTPAAGVYTVTVIG